MNLCGHISPMNFLVNEAKFGIFPGEVLTSRRDKACADEGKGVWMLGRAEYLSIPICRVLMQGKG